MPFIHCSQCFDLGAQSDGCSHIAAIETVLIYSRDKFMAQFLVIHIYPFQDSNETSGFFER